ncbi:GIY-YIG nuclease family protein [Rhodobacteraceae bacterium CH30]|nr:GIY-YIG nuclease family protein [Rhodobacteraceae bacterium CH30]
MLLSKFLAAAGVTLDEQATKVHFASDQGDDPLHAFYEGHFKDWQEEQTRLNFSTPYLIGLIQLADKTSWLYAGLYQVLGVTAGKKTAWQYQTELVPGQDELIGRLVVRHVRVSRNSYLHYKTCGASLEVAELKKQRANIASFPGYKDVLLKKQELDLIVSQNIESWRAALSSVSGVYVIVDRSSGKQYVGSAYGAGGFWSRWSEYSANGHGDNKELCVLLAQDPANDHARHFQYSIIEVCDVSLSSEQVIARESHWKNVLCSRAHGLNSN